MKLKKTNKENNYKSSAFSSYLTKKPESQNPRKTHKEVVANMRVSFLKKERWLIREAKTPSPQTVINSTYKEKRKDKNKRRKGSILWAQPQAGC